MITPNEIDRLLAEIEAGFPAEETNYQARRRTGKGKRARCAEFAALVERLEAMLNEAEGSIDNGSMGI